MIAARLNTLARMLGESATFRQLFGSADAASAAALVVRQVGAKPEPGAPVALVRSTGSLSGSRQLTGNGLAAYDLAVTLEVVIGVEHSEKEREYLDEYEAFHTATNAVIEELLTVSDGLDIRSFSASPPYDGEKDDSRFYRVLQLETR